VGGELMERVTAFLKQTDRKGGRQIIFAIRVSEFNFRTRHKPLPIHENLLPSSIFQDFNTPLIIDLGITASLPRSKTHENVPLNHRRASPPSLDNLLNPNPLDALGSRGLHDDLHFGSTARLDRVDARDAIPGGSPASPLVPHSTRPNSL
jgi:hypothetical protein